MQDRLDRLYRCRQPLEINPRLRREDPRNADFVVTRCHRQPFSAPGGQVKWLLPCAPPPGGAPLMAGGFCGALNGELPRTGDARTAARPDPGRPAATGPGRPT